MTLASALRNFFRIFRTSAPDPETFLLEGWETSICREAPVSYRDKCKRLRLDGPTPCLCCEGECVGGDWPFLTIPSVKDAKVDESFRVDGWDDEPVDYSVDGEPRFPIEKLDERFRSAEGAGHGDPTL